MKKRNRLTLWTLAIFALSFLSFKGIAFLLTTRVNDTIQAETVSDTTIIVLDPGHGGYDTGSISYDGVYEKEITLDITRKVGARLEEEGYEVVYTRTDDEVIWPSDNKEDLQTRIDIAKEADADYFISLHTNASSGYDDGAYGFEIYLDGSDETINAMAEQLGNNLESLQYSQNRGIKTTEDYSLYVIDQNPVPAMLLELGFITDSEEVDYMVSEQGQEALATSIANGIISTLEASSQGLEDGV